MPAPLLMKIVPLVITNASFYNYLPNFAIALAPRSNTKLSHFVKMLSHFVISVPLCNKQKQPSSGALRKVCSENMQQIYRRKPMPKCNFNKVVKGSVKYRFFPHLVLYGC